MMKNEIIDKTLLEIIKSITNLNTERLNSVSIIQDFGYINISLDRSYVLKESNIVSIGLNGTVRLTLIEKLWDDFAVQLGIFQPTLSHIFISDRLRNLEGPETYVFGAPHYLTQGIHYTHLQERKNKFSHFELSAEGFKQIEEKYSWIYHDLFLPKLKETLDINFLDSTINDKVELIDGIDSDYFLALGGIIFRRIILAKLSGNPLYHSICEYHKDKMSSILEMAENMNMPHLKQYPIALKKVCERLEEVKPMENTKLQLNLF